MACYDNIISIRGLCDQDNAKYYLDDYGFSLKSASKIADERFITGKRLLSTIIDRAWRDTFKDISFDGFKANQILSEDTIGVNTDNALPSVAGFNGVSFELDSRVKLGRIYLNQINLCVKTGGATSIILDDNGTQTTLYTGVVGNNENIELTVNQFVGNKFSILVDTTNIEVCSGSAIGSCSCERNYIYVGGGQNYGLVVDLQVRCDIEKYLCKFSDVLAQAVIYKALAYCHFETLISTRLNDFVTANKKEEVAQLVGLYDSSINVFQYLDSKVFVGGRPSTALGQYQLELEKISIPKPKCNYCIECKDNQYIISIP